MIATGEIIVNSLTQGTNQSAKFLKNAESDPSKNAEIIITRSNAPPVIPITPIVVAGIQRKRKVNDDESYLKIQINS